MFEDIFEAFKRGISPDPNLYLSSAEERNKFALASVSIDSNNLNSEFICLSSQYAYFAEKYTDAVKKHQLAKAESENTRASKLLYYREAAKMYASKSTVDEINARVQLDAEVRKTDLDLLNADIERQKLKQILDAIMIKRDMLQSLGAKVRAEMSLEPVTRSF